MSHLIIGIHGFAPKPSPDILNRNWRLALEEGLRRNCRLPVDPETSCDLFDFELIYWADQIHLALEEDPEPYTPAPGIGPLPRYRDDWVDELLADLIDVGESLMDMAMKDPRLHRKMGWLLDRVSRDCERYNQDARLRGAIRKPLEAALIDAVGKKKILVIGHSMGSAIAYEVLRDLESQFSESIVEHLISIGSPLGFPFLTRDLGLRHGTNRVPNTTKQWSNLTDRRDLAALDAHLKDDFGPNSHGCRIDDDLVINTYQCPLQRPNCHNAYGYLRTPEISDRILDFLNSSSSHSALPPSLMGSLTP